MRDFAAWILAFIVFFATFAFSASVSAFDQPECAEDAVLVQEAGEWVCGPSWDDQPIVESGVFPDCDSPDYLVGIGAFEPNGQGEYEWDAFACGYDAPLEQGLTNVGSGPTVLAPARLVEIPRL